MDNILEAKGISVIYPNGVVANNDVNLEVHRGEVLALLGENGAGKTTFIKVVAGLIKPLKGEILIDGERYSPSSYRDALRRGIYMVPQNPKLFDGLTVLEDIVLTLRTAGRISDRRDVLTRISALSERLGIKLDLSRKCWTLSIGEKQRVEILKALLLDSKLIMFDEPTTHMTPHEFLGFQEILRTIVAEGRSAIFVTHKIHEALKTANRIAVMRRGKVVGVLDKDRADKRLLVELMFDSNSSAEFSQHQLEIEASLGEVLLKVKDLWVRDYYGQLAVRGVSFTVRRGEVLGVAGVAGNGQLELFEAIVGLRKPAKGSIILDGEDVTSKGPEYRVRKGLAIVPEERLGWGLVQGLSIAENIAFSLLSINSMFKGVLINWGLVRRVSKEIVSMVNIKSIGIDMPVDTLSGGNMQKLMVARELYKRPRVLVAMNPTGGLDLSTAVIVRNMILENARNSATLVISEDLEELLTISTRIVVLSKGSIKGTYSKPFIVDNIIRAMVN
ncbi:MAG: ABC transporter ATP-binding protein [Sulfolobales archaeon]